MSLFTDTMTVYNYHREHGDPETESEIWKRTVINGIQWSHNKIERTISDGVQTETKVESITIDFQQGHGNKPYIEPNAYAKLSAEECSKYWTLNAKCGQDVLVLGIADKEISRAYRLSELSNDYQYVATISSVSDNRNRNQLKHIKVVAK